MSTDHRGIPLKSVGGAIPHLHRVAEARRRQKTERELREMGGGATLMGSNAPSSREYNYDKDYEGPESGDPWYHDPWY